MGNKWADIESLKLPARTCARQIITERMAFVQRQLPLAAYHFAEDVEFVHQLRVGCRRAAAALRAFEPLLDSPPKSLKKCLRQIRQSAGPARDLDVLLPRFQTEPLEDPVVQYALARLTRERAEAQERLVQVARHAARGQLVRSVETCLELLARKKQPAGPNWKQFARSALHLVAATLLQLSQVASPTLVQLHQLRIGGKRLRYSIEIFHGAVDESLRAKTYPLMIDLQNRLGAINDHAAAQLRFQEWLASMKADHLSAALARRAVAEYELALQLSGEFLAWWQAGHAEELQSALRNLAGE